MSETTHEANHYPRERFLYFLGMWAREWEEQLDEVASMEGFAFAERVVSEILTGKKEIEH